MSLVEIKHHMMQVQMATLGSLCSLFCAEPDTVRCLLNHWIQKGRIRKCTKKPACGSKCFQCPVKDIEMYEWVSVA